MSKETQIIEEFLRGSFERFDNITENVDILREVLNTKLLIRDDDLREHLSTVMTILEKSISTGIGRMDEQCDLYKAFNMYPLITHAGKNILEWKRDSNYPNVWQRIEDFLELSVENKYINDIINIAEGKCNCKSPSDIPVVTHEEMKKKFGKNPNEN
jgi:hypothetical protein